MTDKPTTETITESRFYMWRALFAIAHADEVVSSEERSFMRKTLQTYPFSPEQAQTLENDMQVRQDVNQLFEKITDPQDRSQFFDYARTMVWCDGNYEEKEQQILLQLKREHIRSADFETLNKTRPLELEEDEVPYPAYRARPEARRGGFFATLFGGFLGQGKKR